MLVSIFEVLSKSPLKQIIILGDVRNVFLYIFEGKGLNIFTIDGDFSELWLL